MRLFVPAALLAVIPLLTSAFNYNETTIADLQKELAAGRLTAEEIAKHYLETIEALNHKGPKLNGVIEINPHAICDAQKFDEEYKRNPNAAKRGPLHGIPILIKDNIATKGDDTTTGAGSLALIGSIVTKEAFLVKKLRQAGAIILGRANMVEWANWRSYTAPAVGADWSARGGSTRNPYVLSEGTSGSSSGSALTVAANMIPVAIGSETDGSIISPASRQAIVGLKPTVGLVSRTGVIPISSRQDSAGPMGRTVRDVALVLEAIAGYDPEDPRAKRTVIPNYSKFLNANSLKGLSVGIDKTFQDASNPYLSPAHIQAFDKAVQVLQDKGAKIVYATFPNAQKLTDSNCEFELLKTEFREDVESYLRTLQWKQGVKPMKTLKDITDFNAANPDTELNVLDQSLMLASLEAPSRTNQTYKDLLKTCNDLAITHGLEEYFRVNKVDVVFSLSDANAQSMPAIAGWPVLSIPLGYNASLPLGALFIGKPYDEKNLLSYGFAFEQATKARVPPTFLPTFT